MLERAGRRCAGLPVPVPTVPWASKGDSAFRLVGASGGSYSSHWDVS